MNWIGKVTSWLGPYAAFVGMVGGLLTSTFAVYKFIIRPQDLTVFVDKQEINYPISINDMYAKVIHYLADSCKDNEIKVAAEETNQYLQNTNNYWKITLHNQTDRSIKGIIIKITDVSLLSAYGINGHFLLDEEQARLMKSVKFEPSSGVIVLNRIESLPPHSDIAFYVWGKFNDIVLDETLIVTYEDGDAHVGHKVTLTGFKAFLSDYVYEIILLLCGTFFVVYRNLIKKYSHVAN